MDCFRLNINTFRSDKRLIPILSRYYETVFINYHQLIYFKPLVRKMLKQLSHSVIDLEHEFVKVNLITLCELLDNVLELDFHCWNFNT